MQVLVYLGCQRITCCKTLLTSIVVIFFQLSVLIIAGFSSRFFFSLSLLKSRHKEGEEGTKNKWIEGGVTMSQRTIYQES